MRIKAFISKILRDITSPFIRWNAYVKNKLRWNGIVRFNRSVWISDSSSFEGANSIGDGSHFSGSMGYGTYLCGQCNVDGNIGRFCSIGYGTRVLRGTHPLQEPFATTSLVFYSLRKQSTVTFADHQAFDELLPPVTIGNDCWIGERVSVLGGRTIGDGAVVLTGAVVTKDVPPYAIVGGVPAKVVKYRYDEETIHWLLKVRWFDRPLDWLMKNSTALCTLEKLKSVLNED